MADGGRGWRRLGGRVRSCRGERGQMLVFFALLIVPVTFVLSAVVVDASLWQSERRGAYKDADLATLSGALELARPAPDEAGAEAEAFASASTNDEAGNAGSDASNVDVTVDNSCFPGDSRADAVAVDLTHDSQTFFSSIFGLDVAPDIGAHAKACAGATQAPNGLVPIQMDLTQAPCFEPGGKPIFGQLCEIEYGAEHDNKDRGVLDLEAPDGRCSDATGSGDLEDAIEFGASGSCYINTRGSCDPDRNGPWDDCVAVQRGNPAKVARAFERRIAREGACDTDGNGYESFEETVTLVVDNADPSLRVYEGRDCEPGIDGDQISPRLVSIIVLEEPPTLSAGNAGYPILAFAGFYVSGCETATGITDEDELDRFCDTPGGGATNAPAGSSAQFVSLPRHHSCEHPGGPPPPPATCTPVPTNTPPSGGPTATPTSDGGEPGGGVGHIVVYGRFVNLIFAGHEAGPPTETTTLFSISLVE